MVKSQPPARQDKIIQDYNQGIQPARYCFHEMASCWLLMSVLPLQKIENILTCSPTVIETNLFTPNSLLML